MLEFLEKAGLGERVKDGFRIYADVCRVGTARAEGTGEKGVVVVLRNSVLHLEMVFVITDRALLAQLRKAAEDVLRGERSPEVG